MTLRLIALSFGLLLAGASCTVDDNIEGKPCDLDKPLNQQCVAGYVCKCETAAREDCFCVAEGRALSLGVTPAPLPPPTPAGPLPLASRDPSRRFLAERLRLDVDRR